MNIAVIGTGNVGRALGGSLARAGHRVTFAARDPQAARAAAADVGASAAGTPAEAAGAAEAVVLAVPYAAVADVAGDLAGSVDGKLVVDPTNPLRPDYTGLATEAGSSAAEELARALPGARVVKAFNTLFATLQATPDAHGTTLDVLFATDDDDARTRTAALVRSLGFRPIDVGPLAAARELEGLAWLNIRLQMRSGGDWRSSFVLVGAPDAAAPAAA